MTKLEYAIQTIDSLIKEGKPREAQQALLALPTKIPRKFVGEVASLSSRVFLPQIGIRLLHPIIRPTRKAPESASDYEKAQYASCLARIGAADEALEILKSVDPKAHPEALLSQMHALVTKWAYEETIPLLQRYLHAQVKDEYYRLVAKVNLASAYAYERRDAEATALLEELRTELAPTPYGLLKESVLSFSAMNAIFQERWGEARAFLAKLAERCQANSMEHLFLRKWYALLDLFEKHKSDGESKALMAVREEAIKRRHWETVRDCDRFSCVVGKKERLFIHLYFGTPHEGFRKWLLRCYPGQVPLPESYEWLQRSSLQGAMGIDLESGLSWSGKRVMKPGELVHSILCVVASDFYAPFRLASLHFRLYPGEFYNPETSPTRIHQALRRFRSWAKSHRLPLDIREEDGRYQLGHLAPFGLRLHRRIKPTTRKESVVDKIRARWKTELFTVPEAAKLIRITDRTVRRALETELANGSLERLGAGPSTHYRFKTAA